MNERDQTAGGPADRPLSAEAGERVRAVIAAAEEAAAIIRHAAEQEAQISRRDAQAEAERYLREARRKADELVSERTRRLSELSDAVLAHAESIAEPLERADALRGELQTLVHVLTATAERVAREVAPHEPTGGRAFPQAPPAGASPVPLERVGPELGVADPPRVDPGPEAGPAPETEPAPQPGPAPEAERVPEAGPPPPGPSRPLTLSSSGRAEAGAGDTNGPRLDEPPYAAFRERLGARRPTGRFRDGGRRPQWNGAYLVARQMAVAGGTREEVGLHLRRAFDLPDPAEILDEVFGAGSPSESRLSEPSS